MAKSIKSIDTLLDDLPERNLTIYMLQAFDFLVPGQWQNIVGFENNVRVITGESDPAMIQRIKTRSVELYNDPNNGYQRAVWLYQTADALDSKFAMAALANKVGEKISFLSVLNRLTPKPDTIQKADLVVKLLIEFGAFTTLNGVPRSREGLMQFTNALSTQYRHESLMRMATLVAVDAVLPLGPNFAGSIVGYLDSVTPTELEQNSAYQQVGSFVPGEDSASRLQFVKESFNSVQGWMTNMMTSRGITPDTVLGSLKKFIEFSDSKVDYAAMFVDKYTDYFAHTGVQTVGRIVITRAAEEVKVHQLPGGATTYALPAGQPATGQSMFGGMSQQQQPVPVPASGGMFGSTPPASTGTGLFASFPSQPSQSQQLPPAAPSQGTGMFGSTPSSGGMFGQAPPSSGGMFGQAPTGTGGLFATGTWGRLTVVNGPQIGASFPLTKAAVIIGKSGDVALQDEKVSARHFQLERRGTQAALTDLNFIQQTRVDNELVADTILRGGEIIKIGNTELRFEIA